MATDPKINAGADPGINTGTPYVGPTVGAPTTVTPGVGTSTRPPITQPRVPANANIEVTANAIPEPVPTAVSAVPNPGNTTVTANGLANANANATITTTAGRYDSNTYNIYNTYYSNIKVYDETTLITNAVQQLYFVGSGVTVTGNDTAIITIPGSNGGTPAGNTYEIQWKGSNGNFAATSSLKFIDTGSNAGGLIISNGRPITQYISANYVTTNGQYPKEQYMLWKDESSNNVIFALGVYNNTVGNGLTALEFYGPNNSPFTIQGTGNVKFAGNSSNGNQYIANAGVAIGTDLRFTNDNNSNAAAGQVGIYFSDNTYQYTAYTGQNSGIRIQEEGTNIIASANTMNFVGNGVLASNVGNVATITISTGIFGIAVQEQGTNVVASANTVNFLGNLVTASNVSNVATITINGPAVQEEGTNVIAATNILNFVGAGVTASNVGNVATITIAGAAGAVAGTNTQVQFNDEGEFGADANLVFDKTNGNLTVGSNVVAVNFIGSGANTPTITSGTNLDLIANAAVRVPSNISLYGPNVALGDISNIYIPGGNSGQAIITDGAGNLSWGNAGGSGNAAGANTQLQFNNAGAFGANANLTYDYTSGNFSVGDWDSAWIDGETGDAFGNLHVRGEILVGTNPESDDTYGTIRMLTGANAYGFETTSSGILAITNEEASFHQAIILGDSLVGNSQKTIFGVSALNGNTDPSTGQEPEWEVALDVQGANLFVPVISAGSTSNILYFDPTNGRVSFAPSSNASVGIAIQEEGANVVTKASIVNFVGNGVTASNVAGVATITIPGGGDGTPGGANTQVQYNDNGIFGGNPAFTFDESNSLVTANNFVATSSANLGDVANVTIGGGTANYVLSTDGSGVLSWANLSAVSNIAAGGANTQVQYNDDGILGGNPGFTFDEANSLVTANNFVATSSANLGDASNVTVLGGTNGYYLQTDGAGNLTWAPGSSSTGNGEVAGANTQVQFNDEGNFGAVAGFTFNKTSTTLTANNIIASSTANLGDVANVTIGGGTANFVLTTNGSGVLSWTDGSAIGNVAAGGANTQIQYNDDGILGGNPAFTFDEGTSLVTANNLTVSSVTRLGNVSNVHIDGGTANYVLITDGAGGLTWANLAAGGAGNIKAGGANTQVQYNDNGILGGNPAFTFDESNALVTANNLTVSAISRLGNVGNVKITGGNNGYFLQTDGAGNLVWGLPVGLPGNGSVAGANTQIQFNDSGNFGAVAGFTFNKSTTTFTANNIVGTSTVNFQSASNVALGAVANVHITGGNANFILTTDGTGNLSWANLANGGAGNIGAGGANTQVQYNDNGILGGNPGMTFDEGNTKFTANNLVATSTANLGAVGNVIITGGTNGYVLQTDGAGNLSWTAQTGGGGSNGLPGGSDTQVQYNDAGVFGGNAGFTFSEANTRLTANNFVATSTANLGAVGNVTITGGSANFVLTTNGSGGLTWANLAAGGAGNIKAGGANTQVQYNDDGILGGNPAFTFDEGNTLIGANNLTVSSITRLGNVGNVKITGGSANYVLTTDGTGNLTWGTGGLANVAGSNTQIQFNDDGVFGANAGFTFDKSTGWMRSPGNISALDELHFGVDVGFANTTDQWGRLHMFQGNASGNTFTGYGFTYQNTGVGTTHLAVTNEEGNFNQALIMADGGTDVAEPAGTAFGFSVLDSRANSSPTTGNEAGWVPLMDLNYNGNFMLPGINEYGTNVHIPDSGTANVGGVYVRGKSYLNDVSNVTIEGGNPLDVLVTTDGAGNVAWATLEFSPGGANIEVQYNDEGVFGGNPAFTFNKDTTTVTANNFIATTSANLGSNANVIITGGIDGQVLTTDGAGNLSWTDGIGNLPGGYYLHTQSVASNVWTITHNLNRQYVTVEPVDAANISYNGRYDYSAIEFVDENTLILTWETAIDGYAAVVGGGITYNTSISVQDEGNTVVSEASTINFVGPAVTATNFGGVATINITGIPGVIVQDEGTTIVASTSTVNFVGAGVTTSNVGGVATVTVPGTSAGDVVYNKGNVSGATTINVSDGTIQICSLVGNTTFNIASVTNGKSLTLLLNQYSTPTPATISFSSGAVKYAANFKTLSTVYGSTDMLNIVNIGGTYYATLTVGYV